MDGIYGFAWVCNTNKDFTLVLTIDKTLYSLEIPIILVVRI